MVGFFHWESGLLAQIKAHKPITIWNIMRALRKQNMFSTTVILLGVVAEEQVITNSQHCLLSFFFSLLPPPPPVLPMCTSAILVAVLYCVFQLAETCSKLPLLDALM